MTMNAIETIFDNFISNLKMRSRLNLIPNEHFVFSAETSSVFQMHHIAEHILLIINATLQKKKYLEVYCQGTLLQN